MDLDEVKLRQLCRACATGTGTMLDLFGIDQNGVVLAEMLSTCIQRQIGQSDVLPSNICLSCTDRLCSAYEFCQLAKKNDDKLQGMVAAASIHGSVAADYSECHGSNDGGTSDASIDHSFFDGNAIKTEPRETVEAITQADPLQSPEKVVSQQLQVLNTSTRRKSSKAKQSEILKKVATRKLRSKPPTKPLHTATAPKMVGPKRKYTREKTSKQFECYLCKVVLNRSLKESRAHFRSHVRPNIDAKKSTRKRSTTASKPRSVQRPTIASEGKCAEQRSPEQFECYLCKVGLESVADVEAHLRLHDDGTPHRCQICSMRYSRKGLAEHLCHGRSVQCEYCPDIFHATASLLQHLKGHKQQEKLYKCRACPQRFPMKFLRDMHRLAFDVNRPFQCDNCCRRYDDKHKLKNHCVTHSKLRPHLCATCGLGFKLKASLRSHAMRHSDFKPVACPKCPRRFYDKIELRNHMEVHSDIKYNCDLCGNTLSTKRSLAEHLRLRHYKIKEHSCDLCPMKFCTAYKLRRHQLTHTGEKPYKCQHCERAFAQNGDLVKHLRSHIGENTYQCDVCEQRFRLHKDLRNHLFEHYQNEPGSVSRAVDKNAQPPV